MQHPFKSIALIGNARDERVAECMLALTRHLGARGLRPLIDSRQPALFPADAIVVCPEQSLATRADLIISIGGDGTLLYAASLVAAHSTPLLGINRGRLGFLTDVGPASMLEDVDAVLEGRYSRDLRSLISARLQREGAPMARALALNDVVVNKRDTGRIMELETAINGRYVNSHGGDGLVVATATGSTAYALSCGGPIVEPDLDVWVMAPISPHTLSDRPVIVRAGSHILVQLTGRIDSHAQVTCDGTTLGEMRPGDSLHIEGSDAQITLLHPPGYDYYRLLRSKLHWGRGGVSGDTHE